MIVGIHNARQRRLPSAPTRARLMHFPSVTRLRLYSHKRSSLLPTHRPQLRQLRKQRHNERLPDPMRAPQQPQPQRRRASGSRRTLHDDDLRIQAQQPLREGGELRRVHGATPVSPVGNTAKSRLSFAISMPTNMVSSVSVILPSCSAKGSCSVTHPYDMRARWPLQLSGLVEWGRRGDHALCGLGDLGLFGLPRHAATYKG